MTTKHMPCGKPGCINCAPAPTGFIALTEDEQRLREFILDRNRASQNIAPGSPLYDRLMGSDIHRPTQQQTNKHYADLLDVAQRAPTVDMIDAKSFKAGERAGVRRTIKLIAKLATFFVLAIALGMFALAVFA